MRKPPRAKRRHFREKKAHFDEIFVVIKLMETETYLIASFPHQILVNFEKKKKFSSL